MNAEGMPFDVDEAVRYFADSSNGNALDYLPEDHGNNSEIDLVDEPGSTYHAA